MAKCIEAGEIYNYYSCLQYETNARVKSIWERFLEYELGHLHYVTALFEKFEKRDVAQITLSRCPSRLNIKATVEFVRKPERKWSLQTRDKEFIDKDEESADAPSVVYREQMNSNGSPSETVASGYKWKPGTELAEKTPDINKLQKKVA